MPSIQNGIPIFSVVLLRASDREKKDENYAGERIANPNAQQFIYVFICMLQSPDYYNHI